MRANALAGIHRYPYWCAFIAGGFVVVVVLPALWQGATAVARTLRDVWRTPDAIPPDPAYRDALHYTDPFRPQ